MADWSKKKLTQPLGQPSRQAANPLAPDGHELERLVCQALNGLQLGSYTIEAVQVEPFSEDDRNGIDVWLAFVRYKGQVELEAWEFPLQLKSSRTGLAEFFADHRFRVLGNAFGIHVTPEACADPDRLLSQILRQMAEQVGRMPAGCQAREDFEAFLAVLPSRLGRRL